MRNVNCKFVWQTIRTSTKIFIAHKNKQQTPKQDKRQGTTKGFNPRYLSRPEKYLRIQNYTIHNVVPRLILRHDIS